MHYFVYLLECSDRTFYIGYTIDVGRRVLEHNTSNLGAKYTKGRRPIELRYFKEFDNLSEALKYENYLKSLSRKEKKKLIECG